MESKKLLEEIKKEKENLAELLEMWDVSEVEEKDMTAHIKAMLNSFANVVKLTEQSHTALLKEVNDVVDGCKELEKEKIVQEAEKQDYGRDDFSIKALTHIGKSILIDYIYYVESKRKADKKAVLKAIDDWFGNKYPYPNKVSSQFDWLKYQNGMANKKELKKLIIEKIFNGGVG